MAPGLFIAIGQSLYSVGSTVPLNDLPLYTLVNSVPTYMIAVRCAVCERGVVLHCIMVCSRPVLYCGF